MIGEILPVLFAESESISKSMSMWDAVSLMIGMFSGWALARLLNRRKS